MTLGRLVMEAVVMAPCWTGWWSWTVTERTRESSLGPSCCLVIWLTVLTWYVYFLFVVHFLLKLFLRSVKDSLCFRESPCKPHRLLDGKLDWLVFLSSRERLSLDPQPTWAFHSIHSSSHRPINCKLRDVDGWQPEMNTDSATWLWITGVCFNIGSFIHRVLMKRWLAKPISSTVNTFTKTWKVSPFKHLLDFLSCSKLIR